MCGDCAWGAWLAVSSWWLDCEWVTMMVVMTDRRLARADDVFDHTTFAFATSTCTNSFAQSRSCLMNEFMRWPQTV